LGFVIHAGPADEKSGLLMTNECRALATRTLRLTCVLWLNLAAQAGTQPGGPGHRWRDEVLAIPYRRPELKDQARLELIRQDYERLEANRVRSKYSSGFKAMSTLSLRGDRPRISADRHDACTHPGRTDSQQDPTRAGRNCPQAAER
jgi:hypothetical protein